MAQSKSDIGKAILRRVRWLYFFFLVAAVAIFGRILWIQYGPDGEELRERAMEITFDRRAIPAQRGDILARDGRILATTIPEYDVRMDFAVINMADTTFERQADSLSLCLSGFFGDRTKGQYKKILVDSYREKEKNRYKRILPRKINYEEQKQVAQFPIFRLGKYKGGYIAEVSSRRFPPMGSLARKAIGAVESDTIARDGIEAAYNDALKGIHGNSMMQKISGTFWVPVPDAMNVEPVNGMDVVTTIDVDIQDVAESVLKEQLEWGAADWGTVILMEVATGEIHAMCNLTRTGPNRFAEDFNYAIRSRNEPGSTFKLATLITLLEDAGMSITDMVDCTSDPARKAWVGRAHITDDHREGVVSLKRVFEVSSNIGFARSVFSHYENHPERFVDFVSNKLRFGAPTGVDLPNEILPDIKHPTNRNRWDRTTLQRMAYGYAFEITPLQTVTLYNAVANGGVLMKPMMVREVRSYGQTIEKFEPVVLDSAICSPANVRAVRECLEGVVDEGTGRVLKNPYYTAAAKTGTAQMVQASGGYGVPGRRDYLASFVGYFPADNPKYSCIVVIKTKQQPGKVYYGAPLAGPVFRAIADRVYAASIDLHDSRYPAAGRKPAVEDIKGGVAGQVYSAAQRLGLPYDIPADDGGWWSAYGAVVPGAAEYMDIIDYTGDSLPEITADIHQQYCYVPELKGMGLRDAVYLLESSGLKAGYSGRGEIVSQSVPAGTKVLPGTVVNLKLGS